MTADYRFRKSLTRIGALATAGLMITALAYSPQLRAQSSQPAAASAPSFEVASIKPKTSDDGNVRVMFAPDGFTANGVTTKFLVGFAYNLKDFQISGGPGWVDSEKYDINAKMDEATIEALKKLPPEQAQEQRRLMLQSLLAERFSLKVSQSSKDLPIYALVVVKSGSRLSPVADSKSGSADSPGPKSLMRMAPGGLTATGIPISLLVDRLSREVGRKVVDKTGLTGAYDFTLQWTPDRPVQGFAPAEDKQGPAAPAPDSSGPSIFTALQEQLGLKLESQKGPVETLVIESIEKPSEN